MYLSKRTDIQIKKILKEMTKEFKNNRTILDKITGAGDVGQRFNCYLIINLCNGSYFVAFPPRFH